MPKLSVINELPAAEAMAGFLKCNGSSQWAEEMTEARPFSNADDLFEAAKEIWQDLPKGDWMEAFEAHPPIGDKSSKGWAKDEQKGAEKASAATLAELEKLNKEYLDKFGFVFLIFASGKSADEMLAQLKKRIGNEQADEMRTAAEEQTKITQHRLEKWLKE